MMRADDDDNVVDVAATGDDGTHVSSAMTTANAIIIWREEEGRGRAVRGYNDTPDPAIVGQEEDPFVRPKSGRYLLKRNGHRSPETRRLGSCKDSHWGSWKDSHWHWGSRKDSHWHCSARLSNRVVLGLSAWLSARGSQRWITLRGLIVWPQRVALSVGL